MEKDFEERLRNLCFDVLGDHTEESNWEIQDLGKHGIGVLIKRPRLVYSPIEFMKEDFYNAIKGTEFENVGLWMPQD